MRPKGNLEVRNELRTYWVFSEMFSPPRSREDLKAIMRKLRNKLRAIVRSNREETPCEVHTKNAFGTGSSREKRSSAKDRDEAGKDRNAKD